MLKRRTPLRRGGPMKRRTRIASVNRKRKAASRAARFGEQADRCRISPCVVCGRTPCDPHHEPTVARGGLDENTLPLCREHHDERHSRGRVAFEAKWGIDLVHETQVMAALVSGNAPA